MPSPHRCLTHKIDGTSVAYTPAMIVCNFRGIGAGLRDLYQFNQPVGGIAWARRSLRLMLDDRSPPVATTIQDVAGMSSAGH